MPFEYRWEDRGFHSRFWGRVTDEDIELKNRKFSSNSRCSGCAYQIFDGSGIEALELSVDGIAKMASNDIGMGFYLKRFSVALIGSKPEVIIAFEKYIETCRQANLGWSFHICRTLADAREWLEDQQHKAVANYPVCNGTQDR